MATYQPPPKFMNKIISRQHKGLPQPWEKYPHKMKIICDPRHRTSVQEIQPSVLTFLKHDLKILRVPFPAATWLIRRAYNKTSLKLSYLRVEAT